MHADDDDDALTTAELLADDTDIVDIPVIDGRTLTCEQVYERFLLPNRPFIALGVADSWPARRDWIDKDGLPAWSYLIDHFGASEVNVVRCPKRDSAGVEDGEVDKDVPRTFGDVARLWRSGQGQGLYIKDWHLPRRQEEQAEKVISTSLSVPFFTPLVWAEDDWMHNYYRNNTSDDFSFVYFGTKDTYTLLHRDVYASYSWSANVLGCKRWHFVRPSQIAMCREDASDPTSPLCQDPRDVVNENLRVVTVEQPENSVIFVPSNWYHMVENISPFVISINRNWCNSVNIRSMYEAMKAEVEATELALDDVRELIWTRRKDLLSEADRQREWEATVQEVVKQNAGWNWETFWSVVAYNLRNPSTVTSHRVPQAYVQRQVQYILRNFASERRHLYTFTQDRNSIGLFCDSEEDSRSGEWRNPKVVGQLHSNRTTLDNKDGDMSPAEQAWLIALNSLTESSD